MATPPRINSDTIMEEFVNNTTEGKLLRPKKKKQIKLKEAFLQRNFQKYPIKQCVYDATTGKHIYQPPKYKRVMEVEGLDRGVCCASCYLTPCIMVGRRHDFLESLADDQEDPDFAINNAGALSLILFHRLCGKLWTRRMKIEAGPPRKIPMCVSQTLPELMRQVAGEAKGKGSSGVAVGKQSKKTPKKIRLGSDSDSATPSSSSDGSSMY